MKISCPACSAKYSIADEKVKDRLAKIRCRKCGTTIVIDGKVNPPMVQAADGGGHALSGDAGHAGAHANPEFSVDFGENDQRSMTLDALVAAYNDGLVTADTFVWAESFDDWKPLGEVEEIVEALHAAAQAEPDEERPAAAVAPSSPWDARGRVDVPLRAATKASGADLFGRIEHVGSEADVTTSAPEDLPMATATGARNESSVLFSLSALTSAANASRPSQPPMAMSGGGGRDDSGLIDLKALTEAAARSETAQPQMRMPAPVLGVAPLGMAPLGVAGPLGGVMATASGASFDAPAPAKNRSGLLIGGGVVIAALVIAGAIVLTRPAPPPPAPPPVAAAVPVPVPVAAPSVDEKAEALAAAAKKAEEDKAKADAEEKAKTQGTRRWRPPPPKGGGDSPVTNPKTPTSSGDEGEKKKPPKKGNPCGCAPSDLQCNMRCAAGG